MNPLRRWFGRQKTTDKSPPAEPVFDPSRCVLCIGGVRTGTTVFRQMLASHPGFVDCGEIFNTDNPRGYYAFLQARVCERPEMVLPGAAAGNLRAYLAFHSMQGGISVFDVKYEHLLHLPCPWQLPYTNPVLLRMLRKLGLRTVHLRRNPFHSIVSNLVANQTRDYHHYRGHNKGHSKGHYEGHANSHSNERHEDHHKDRPETAQSDTAQTKVHIDREFLLGAMASRRRITAEVDQVLPTSRLLALDYEAIFTREGRFAEDTCQRVARFLEVEDLFVREPALEKVIAAPLSTVVENYAEIADLEAGQISADSV